MVGRARAAAAVGSGCSAAARPQVPRRRSAGRIGRGAVARADHSRAEQYRRASGSAGAATPGATAATHGADAAATTTRARRTAGSRRLGRSRRPVQFGRRPEPRRDGAAPGGGPAASGQARRRPTGAKRAEAGARAARHQRRAGGIHGGGACRALPAGTAGGRGRALRARGQGYPRRQQAGVATEIALRQPRTGDGELARPSEHQALTAQAIARRVRLATVVGGVAGLLLTAASAAVAQDISINFGQGGAQGGGLTERVIQLVAFLTVLSLAPSILIMMTSFTRIVVVLSLLRTALGTATAPPNAVIVALALFLTAFVMAPALQRAYDGGIRPLINNEITVEQAFERASEPLKVSMQKNVREKDLALFSNLSREPQA